MPDNQRGWEVQIAPEGVKGQTIQDYLYFEGMFNPIARFAFTNVLDEDFSSKWSGQTHAVKAHQTVKLPHYLAAKFTKEIVDILMNRDNRELFMAVPAMRKPYEDRVLALLPDEQSTELEIIKSQFIEQLQRDTARPEGVPDEPVDNLELDFDDLRNRDIGKAAAPKAKKK